MEDRQIPEGEADVRTETILSVQESLLGGNAFYLDVLTTVNGVIVDRRRKVATSVGLPFEHPIVEAWLGMAREFLAEGDPKHAGECLLIMEELADRAV